MSEFEKFLHELTNNKYQVIIESLSFDTPIAFGTDLKNSQWHTDSKQMWTFFTYEKLYYVVIIALQGGNIAFATSNVFDEKKHSDSNSMYDDFTLKERETTTSPLKIFSFALNIAFKGLKKLDKKKFEFYGQSDKLASIYKRIVHDNKSFKKLLHDNLFMLYDEKYGVYKFQKYIPKTIKPMRNKPKQDYIN